MNERKIIKIEVNPTNPVEYLACLGIFEIASRFDETALAHWQIDEGKAIFFIESERLEDKDLLGIILPTLTDLSKWQAIYPNGKRSKLSDQTKTEEDNLVQLEATLSNSDYHEVRILFDWWYESIRETGEATSSKWKMYAARQNPAQISESFITESIKLLKSTEITSLTDLLKTTIKSQSKFGFDPRPCVGALDLGFVPNDVTGKDSKFSTYLYAEMLSVFGAHSFFPARTARPKETQSTRSWKITSTKNKKDDNFIYSLWLNKSPISLARVLASANKTPTNNLITFNSVKEKRGDYLGNLKFSSLLNNQ